MSGQEQLMDLGSRVWEHRRANGFSKKLPINLQSEAVKLVQAGTTAYSVSKVIGVPRNTISDWVNRVESENQADFTEAKVVERPQFEVKLSSVVQGCRVEITGHDFTLLQRILRRLDR